MRVTLEYGRTGLEVELPDASVVRTLSYRSAEPLGDPAAALRQRLEQPTGSAPLAERAARRQTACVLICDITRPVPNELRRCLRCHASGSCSGINRASKGSGS